jgi:FtsH-binding integral membrane protein
MSYSENPYASPLGAYAAVAEADERANFITKTYLHLTGAIALFVALETLILKTVDMQQLMQMMFASRLSWFIVLGLFMFVSYVANNWAASATSVGMQYAGLGLYVVAEAVIFSPLLYIASVVPKFEGVISSAAVATLGLFVILTAVVFITRKDFSFLRSILMFGGFAALGFIAVAMIFNFQLGPIFTYAMIAFACGYILYDTSNVLHHYRIGQHVAAALALFASVALLFWYILQLFMRSRD